MKTPALLLAAALALWGYASSHWLIAALLAAGVLLPTILRLKFDLEDRELNRAADLSSLLTAGAFIYFLSTSQTAQALFSAASWLPACLYPLLLAALFGRQPLRRRHLFYTLRRSQRPQAQREIDVTPLYFATTVLAAGVAPQANPWFYPGLCGLLILWIFFSLPGPRWRRSLPFIPLAALAGELGFLGAGSLQHTQQFLQEWYVEQLSDTSDDPYRSQTRIGDLGNIKLSDRIIWRVAMPGTTPLPLYLRDGVFTAFDGQAWNARRDSFKPFSEAKTDGGQQLEIAGSSRKGQALLALPQGTRAIEGLPASIEHNSYGIVRLKEAPDWLRFTVRYSTLPDSAPPDAGDLIVARHYTNLFARIPAITALAGGSELDKLRGVEAYFANQFRYTLALGKDTSQNRDIERFLLHDKAGHCEYFATATVLLLRHLGIPARYVTGYSLQEYSALEKRFVARQRHAHAWVEAWIGGRWQQVDTTPSNWLTVEEQAAPWWQPASDWLSWAWMRFTEWRMNEKSSDSGHWWLWPVLGGVLILGWRLWQRRAKKRPVSAKPTAIADEFANRLQRLEKEFAALGYARPVTEPPRHWLRRLDEEATESIGEARLLAAKAIIDAHYCQRYNSGK